MPLRDTSSPKALILASEPHADRFARLPEEALSHPAVSPLQGGPGNSQQDGTTADILTNLVQSFTQEHNHISELRRLLFCLLQNSLVLPRLKTQSSSLSFTLCNPKPFTGVALEVKP